MKGHSSFRREVAHAVTLTACWHGNSLGDELGMLFISAMSDRECLKVARNLNGLAFVHDDERDHVHRTVRFIAFPNSEHLAAPIGTDPKEFWKKLVDLVTPIVFKDFFGGP
jgi:hypothetical protein